MKTILIIDDSKLTRIYLAHLLGHHGYRVVEAGDGSEALALMRSEHPDLAIADLLMPATDGFEFVRAVRGDAATAGTPVIFLTGTYQPEDVTALARACGVSCVLSKSCTADDLLKAVGEALEAPASPAVAVPREEFSLEHLRLLTEKLTKHMRGFVRSMDSFIGEGQRADRPGEPEPSPRPDAH